MKVPPNRWRSFRFQVGEYLADFLHFKCQGGGAYEGVKSVSKVFG